MTPPAITGNPDVGSTLTVDNGTWTGDPTDYDYQWYVQNVGPIPGANSNTYVVAEGDVGHNLYSDVTASNYFGSGTASSNLVFIPATPGFTWAYRFINQQANLWGVRAKIKTPPDASYFEPPLGAAVAFSVQAVAPGYGMQVGFGRGQLGQCFSQPLVNFIEWRVPPDEAEECFVAGSMTYNTILKYTLKYQTGGWQAFVDGVPKGPVIPMGVASDIRAWGEISSGDGIAAARFGGGSPAVPWERFNGTDWITIRQAGICETPPNGGNCTSSDWIFDPVSLQNSTVWKLTYHSPPW